jgi:hypothetical protein
LEKSEELRVENENKFSMNSMKETFRQLIEPFIFAPKPTKLVLPKLTKIE